MRIFYSYVLGISIVLCLLLNAVTFATSSEEAAAWRLAHQSKDWDLVFKDGSFPNDDLAKFKERLIRFIQKAPMNSYQVPKTMATVLLTSVVFSVIGLVGESTRGRRKRPQREARAKIRLTLTK